MNKDCAFESITPVLVVGRLRMTITSDFTSLYIITLCLKSVLNFHAGVHRSAVPVLFIFSDYSNNSQSPLELINTAHRSHRNRAYAFMLHFAG